MIVQESSGREIRVGLRGVEASSGRDGFAL